MSFSRLSASCHQPESVILSEAKVYDFAQSAETQGGSCDDHRSSRHRLQQGRGKRPRFLSRCSQISRGGCRSWLADFCRCRLRRLPFHPSEKNDLHELYFMCDDLKVDDGVVEGEESEVWCR